MKKVFYSLLAILTMFVACKPKDNVIDIEKSTLVGKWKIMQQDGQSVLTDNRIVYTFFSDGTGTQTLSADLDNVGERAWYMEQKLKYTLNGNALHTQWTNSTIVFEWLASIVDMNSNQFVVDPSRVLLQTQPLADMPTTTWQRINVDYTDAIIGLWEGTSCTGITYGDHNHRWLYTPSGQYFYYSKDSLDKWVISENSLNEYDVDGDYLACRWKETAESNEDREFWDIAINDKNMNWSALRQNATTKELFNATFTMSRESPTQSEVEKYLPGKWMAIAEDGNAILTNERSVHTFDGHGTVLYTVADTTKQLYTWHNRISLNYSLTGNYLVEKGKDNNNQMVQWRSSLADMSNQTALLYAFSSVRGTKENMPYREIRFKKVTEDYKDAIIGLWEGIEIPGSGGQYGDWHHRWEYLAEKDGIANYKYYSWDEDQQKWVTNENDEDGEYMVDGTWMATRWKNSGVINYEWWDIEIHNDTMSWTGLRPGNVTNIFKMVRVKEQN